MSDRSEIIDMYRDWGIPPGVASQLDELEEHIAVPGECDHGDLGMVGCTVDQLRRIAETLGARHRAARAGNDVEQTERLTAALAAAAGLVDSLNRLVDERASVLADAAVRKVQAAADARVADAERLSADAEERRAGLAAECQRQYNVAERVRERVERERDTARRERDQARTERDAADAAVRRIDEIAESRARDAIGAHAERLEAELGSARAGLAEACALLAKVRQDGLPCDPVLDVARDITTGEMRIVVCCGTDGGVVADVSAVTRWSVVVARAAHRCGVAAAERAPVA